MSSHDLDQERLNLSLKEDFRALLYRDGLVGEWNSFELFFFKFPPPVKNKILDKLEASSFSLVELGYSESLSLTHAQPYFRS